MPKVRMIKVEWDTNDDLGIWHDPLDCGLPELVMVPSHISEDDIGDWLSDNWDYCHFGWSYWSAVEEAKTPSELAYSAAPM